MTQDYARGVHVDHIGMLTLPAHCQLDMTINLLNRGTLEQYLEIQRQLGKYGNQKKWFATVE